MGVAAALRRLDDRVLGPVRPVTTRTHRNGLLVGLLGTAGALTWSSLAGDSTGVAASGGLFAVAVGSGYRWFRALEQEGRWQGRERARRCAAGAGLLVLAVLLSWYAVLLAGGDDDHGYTREQCEVARDGFLTGGTDGRVDEVLRRCAQDGR